MSIRNIVSARRNYDWVSLGVAIIGVLQVSDLSIFGPKVSGFALIGLAIANVSLVWYRAQLGIGGQATLEKPE